MVWKWELMKLLNKVKELTAIFKICMWKKLVYM